MRVFGHEAMPNSQIYEKDGVQWVDMRGNIRWQSVEARIEHTIN
jgi:hypothetical protein